MITQVSTLQELLEAIASASNGDTIQLNNSIFIESSTEISSELDLMIDLNLNKISISTERGLIFTNGSYELIHGCIEIFNPYGICTEGSGTKVIFGNDLQISGLCPILSVLKKSEVVINGAYLDGYASSDIPSSVIRVEGYTNAKNNSVVIVESGTINGGTNNCIDISKKGAVFIRGGVVSSDNHAIYKSDGTSTVAEIVGGLYRGFIPDNTIDTENYSAISSNLNGDSFYTVETLADVGDISSVEATNNLITFNPSETFDINDNSNEDIAEPIVESKSNDELADVVEEIKDPGTKDLAHGIVEKSKNAVIDNSLTSIIVKRPIQIFKTPSTKHPMDTIVGSVILFSDIYEDLNTKKTFKRVQYRVPGSGRKVVGYAFASAIVGENNE